MPGFDVNTNASVVYAAKLEKLHRSAFPNAVREALNSVAFDVKQKSLLRSADAEFIRRQPNFFRANSKVDMARGWDINSMVSTIGMVSLNGNNHAVDDLEQQERGGAISGRSFIPAAGDGRKSAARAGDNFKRNIRRKARISGIGKVVNASGFAATSEMGRMAKASRAAGIGGYILSGNMLWRVNSFKSTSRGLDITALYSYKKSRSVHVNATHFMEKASLSSMRAMDMFFIKAAQKQLAKYYNG